MSLDMICVKSTENITTEHDNRVSRGLYQSMTVTVPISVSIPEKSEVSDDETTFEMFSASLVMRLMRSPCE